jgi:hypothetical protein
MQTKEEAKSKDQELESQQKEELEMPLILDHKVPYNGAVSATTTGTYDDVDGSDNT